MLPTAGEALYEPPNAKKTAKSCANCGLWALDSTCALFGDRAIFSFDVCSYHVNGKPAKKRIRLPIVPLSPNLSGLSWAPQGTRCGTCKHFRADATGPMGDCVRVRDDKRVKLARVHEYGCSSRYVGLAIEIP